MANVDFKNFMSEIPSSVAVIASAHEQVVRACTVSSLISFDVENPGIMILLKGESKTLSVIQQSSHFSVNILAEHQKSLALHFSNNVNMKIKSEDIFVKDENLNIPYLKECENHCFCTLENVICLGDSKLILGRVLKLNSKRAHSPLIYAKRAYFNLGEPLN